LNNFGTSYKDLLSHLTHDWFVLFLIGMEWKLGEAGLLLWRMVEVNKELVESSTQQTSHMRHQPRDPEPVVTSLQ
jgi:hypothetical protein